MDNKTILQQKNTRLNANNVDLNSILNTINNLPEAGSGEPTLQQKTVTPTTSTQNVVADSGYDGLSKVIVNAMPTTTQATPSISVSSSGLITASSTQSAGYVSAGTKSATKQLTTKGATTITPATSNQTIASGTYLTGTQTIKGDSNLIASNIRSGKSIFGVNGTLVEGITPSGELDITTNGTYNVTNYASANVNVASSGGGLITGGNLAFVNFMGSFTSFLAYKELDVNKNYILHLCYDLFSTLIFASGNIIDVEVNFEVDEYGYISAIVPINYSEFVGDETIDPSITLNFGLMDFMDGFIIIDVGYGSLIEAGIITEDALSNGILHGVWLEEVTA